MPLIDTNFIPIVNLQGLFINDIDAKPLAGGYVFFKKDTERQINKGIFKLSGVPGAYTFVPLINPILLTSYGTFQDDLGNDITIYLYPYDQNGNIEKYYLIITDDGGDTQDPKYTRESVPYIKEIESVSQTSLEEYNHFTNGQFGFVNRNIIENFPYDVSNSVDVVDNEFYIVGHKTDFEDNECTNNFYNNCFFAKNNNSGKDTFTLTKIVLGDGDIASSPSHYINHTSFQAGIGEIYKSYGVILGNVRLFNGKQVTFGVNGRSLPNDSIRLSFEQVFGINGSPFVSVQSSDIQLSGIFNKVFWKPTIPSVHDKDIEKNNYLILYIDMPINQVCNVDFINIQVNDTIIEFPYFKRTASEIETYGKSVFLPNIPQNSCITPFETEGNVITLRYDYDRIATPYLEYYPSFPAGGGIRWYTETAPSGWLFNHGTTNSTSRFLRLFNVIGLRYGYGASAISTVSLNEVSVTNTEIGVSTSPIDGTGLQSTGFTFAVVPVIPPADPNLEKQVVKITCNDASTFGLNDNYLAWFRFYTKYSAAEGGGNFEWYVCLFKENLITLTEGFFIYPYTNIVFVNIKESWNANQVAGALKDALNPIGFKIMDERGYLSRVPNGTRTPAIDPDADTRIARPDGVAGNVVGTTQSDEFKSHTHILSSFRNYNFAAGGVSVGRFHPVTGLDTVQTNPNFQDYETYNYNDGAANTYKSSVIDHSGGNESRGPNFGAEVVTKF